MLHVEVWTLEQYEAFVLLQAERKKRIFRIACLMSFSQDVFPTFKETDVDT